MNDIVMTCRGGGEPAYLERMGWYERPSNCTVEFWWQGSKPMIVLDMFMLDFMPAEIVMEIRASTTIKDELFN